MSKLERAKAFSQFEIFIDRYRRTLEQSPTGRLELDYWKHIFDAIYLLGLELDNPRMAADVSNLWWAAHQRGANTINEWIELGKRRGMCEPYEKPFQEAMVKAHSEWCQANGVSEEDWAIGILISNTEYLKHILHVRMKRK